MQIESLTRDKKHCNRLMLNSGKTVFIDIDVSAEYSLKAGMSLEEEQLLEILKRSDFVRAKERALWYLDRADRSERNLSRKLCDAGFSKESIAEVMAFLREYGLIDDRRYARRYAELAAERSLSRLQIRAKLFERGLSKTVIDEALSELPIDETAAITELIEKKYRPKLEMENGREKVYAALIRRGFSHSAVKAALKNYSENLQYYEEY